EVHDTDDGGPSQRCDFNEIEACDFCRREGSLELHDAKLSAISSDDAQWTDANLPVNANAFGLLLNGRESSNEGNRELGTGTGTTKKTRTHPASARSNG